MGRPPCCDKPGVKKGPWTPQEDLILVSYIQEHGPGNWRSVPINTGLLRCSKSCRLRWTNYLRPGIKRGSFTPHEEGIIIHLQALLGNKWAAIATYLPQRTDNDIKNYWNTHLKKKLKKSQEATGTDGGAAASTIFTEGSAMEAASVNQELAGFRSPALPRNSCSSSYASSAENISRLLEGWMRSSEKLCSSFESRAPQASAFETKNENLMYHEELCSFKLPKEPNPSLAEEQNPPLAFLEKWLLDDASLMELPSELF